MARHDEQSGGYTPADLVPDARQRLSRAAASALTHNADVYFFSTVSLWEIAIKTSLGRSDFQIDPRDFYAELILNRFNPLPVEPRHTYLLSTMPLHHRDPFDRMLLAQAITEGMTLVTADPQFGLYEGPVELV